MVELEKNNNNMQDKTKQRIIYTHNKQNKGAHNQQKWTEMDRNGQKWTEMDRNENAFRAAGAGGVRNGG